MVETETPGTAAAAGPVKRRKRATRSGVVVSAKMARSIVVEVERLVMHPLYRRTLRRSIKYMAHDAIGCRQGDRVLIEECRPLSRRKRWIVKRVLQAGSAAATEPIPEPGVAAGVEVTP